STITAASSVRPQPPLVTAERTAIGQIISKSYRFKPGQSGNPNGRPRGTREFAELIAHETRNGEEMLEQLLAMMRDPAHEDHLKAIEVLLDRMLGRAPQTLELADRASAFPKGVVIYLPAKQPVTFDNPVVEGEILILRRRR